MRLNELGLSRAARTHRRWNNAASVHRFLLRGGAQARRLQPISFNRLTPATLKAINELVVEAAVKLGVEDGSKLRVDTTVVETDIHHPTDNTLLWDVVRVLTRLLGRFAWRRWGLRRIARVFTRRSRAAHRKACTRSKTPDIDAAASGHSGSRQTCDAIGRLNRSIAEEGVAGARKALDDTAAMRAKDPLTALKIEALRDEIAHVRSRHAGDRAGAPPRNRWRTDAHVREDLWP